MVMSFMRRFAPLFLIAVLVSCQQTVKRTLPGAIQTIAIEEFSNQTGQIILPSLLHEELRRAFRLDGRLSVVDESSRADAVLSGAITDYTRQPARFDPNNVVEEYRLRMVTDLSLIDQQNKMFLWMEKGPRSTAARGGSIRKLERFLNFAVVPAEAVQAETEQDAQRRMVREFAREIVLKVIEGW